MTPTSFYEKVLPAIIRCSWQEYELLLQYMDELGFRGRESAVFHARAEVGQSALRRRG